jgi:Fe-S-cluster-containing hydrogenase component 2
MYSVDVSVCTGCGVCVDYCATGAISVDDEVAAIDQARCNSCGLCGGACPQGAIYKIEEVPVLRAPARSVPASQAPRASSLSVRRYATPARQKKAVALAVFMPTLLKVLDRLASQLISRGERNLDSSGNRKLSQGQAGLSMDGVAGTADRKSNKGTQDPRRAG